MGLWDNVQSLTFHTVCLQADPGGCPGVARSQQATRENVLSTQPGAGWSVLAFQPQALLITSLVVPHRVSTDSQGPAVNETGLDPLEFPS